MCAQNVGVIGYYSFPSASRSTFDCSDIQFTVFYYSTYILYTFNLQNYLQFVQNQNISAIFLQGAGTSTPQCTQYLTQESRVTFQNSTLIYCLPPTLFLQSWDIFSFCSVKPSQTTWVSQTYHRVMTPVRPTRRRPLPILHLQKNPKSLFTQMPAYKMKAAKPRIMKFPMEVSWPGPRF